VSDISARDGLAGRISLGVGVLGLLLGTVPTLAIAKILIAAGVGGVESATAIFDAVAAGATVAAAVGAIFSGGLTAVAVLGIRFALASGASRAAIID
jgi:hypothetical protein